MNLKDICEKCLKFEWNVIFEINSGTNCYYLCLIFTRKCITRSGAEINLYSRLWTIRAHNENVKHKYFLHSEVKKYFGKLKTTEICFQVWCEQLDAYIFIIVKEIKEIKFHSSEMSWITMVFPVMLI